MCDENEDQYMSLLLDLYRKVKMGLNILTDAVEAVENAILTHEHRLWWKNIMNGAINVQPDVQPRAVFGGFGQNSGNVNAQPNYNH